jgi:F-type H+-transporting ATPase subunit epsilon
MKTVPCEIVTPEKVVLREEAEFIVAPGYEGELGILPGHTRLCARLTAGDVRLVKGNETKKFAISAGFISIEPTSVKIFSPLVRPFDVAA